MKDLDSPSPFQWLPTRRRLLKTVVLGGLVSFKSKFSWARPRTISDKKESWGMLVDLTRCIGCRSCSRSCLETNKLPTPAENEPQSLQTAEVLTYQKYSTVNAQSVSTTAGPIQRFIKRQCMHCVEPACVSVCPVGALDKTASGPVIYRADRCIGCRYCMMACPFDIPKFEWNSGLTPVIGKCEFCARQRIFEGRQPGCVESCPTGALKFGKRQNLLFEARALIHAHPEKYVAHIYGEQEVGGTSWLYLSDVPFESLGFKKNLPTYPLPSLTGEVVSRIPAVVGALAVILGMLGVTLSKEGKPRS